MLSLILPARIQNAKVDVNNQLKTVSEQLTVKSATIEELEQQKLSLEKDLLIVNIDDRYYLREIYDASTLIARRFKLLAHEKELEIKALESESK